MVKNWLLMGWVCTALVMCSLACAEEVDLARNEKAAEQSVAALILTDIYRKAGLTPVIQPLPGARAHAMALAGDKDGEVARVATYAINNPTLIKLEPSYYYLVSTAFAKTGGRVVVKSKNDLKNYRVGVVRGIAHAKAAVEGVAVVEEVATYQQMFQMLESGRIDVAIDTGINGAYMVKKLGLVDVIPVAELARLELFHILTAKGKVFAPRIVAALKGLKDSGELERMAVRQEQAFLKSGAEP